MTTLAMGRFKTADQYNNLWAAALADDQTFEDALEPDFWSHVARFLKPGDTIRLLPERSDYYALLIVTQVGRNFAKVKALDLVRLDDDESQPVVGDALASDLSVEWKGPHVKFAVIRKSDGERLKEGFAVKTEADQWLRDHLAAMAR